MVRDHLVLLVDGGGAVIAYQPTMYDRGEFGWCGGGLELDWMYLGEFSSNFRKNLSGGNSLVVRNNFVLLVDGGGAVISSELTMYDGGELGGGLHGWGCFLHFAMILWAKQSGVGQSDLYTRWERGRGCLIGHVVSVLHEMSPG